MNKMEDAPSPTIQNNNKEKVIELVSNKGNKFIINFINKTSSLFISSIFDNGIIKVFYETIFSLEKIKENKAFFVYDSIEEILGELFPLIDEGKIHLNEETNFIKITFDLPFQKFKNIDFNVNEKKKTEVEKINELYNIIVVQNKEINDLKSDITIFKNEQNNLNNEILELKNRMNDLENILNKKNFEEKIIQNINSNIFNSLDDIDFILNKLRNKDNLRNKKIFLKLLFKATKDGQQSSDFHKKCDGKVQQLVFIKTTKGEIFGGYTEEGYRSREENIKDNNAFVFSFSKQKIYTIKNNATAIADHKNYGPRFFGASYFVIHVPTKMFEERGNTCIASESVFEGITSDYELNNGEKFFYIQEIEVYQVLFN